MTRTRRLQILLLSILICIQFLPVTVSANSPEVPPWYTFYLENVPENVAYVDMLVYLPESDPMYVDMVEENLTGGIAGNADIVEYCTDGYRSYTFHYRNAVSQISVRQQNAVSFFTDSEENVRYEHADEIAARGDVYLAFLDRNGNIMHISQKLILRPREFATYLLNEFRYDAQVDEFEVKSYKSGLAVILQGVIAIIGMFFTVVTERIVASSFGLGQYRNLVLWTNVISQLLMHAGYIAFYSLIFWKYTYATIFLECVVYLGEFLLYLWRMKEVSWKRKLAFTLTANTFSLVFGFALLKAIT